MSKLLVLLCIFVLLAGCIVIKDDEEENKTTRPEINLSFDLEEEETEEPEPIEESATKPDLEITQLIWGTLFPKVNENNRLIIKVVNNGNASVDEFNYKVTLFKGYDAWKEVTFVYEDVLEPGNITKITEMFAFDETGQFKAEVYLDWDNSIKEQGELNNYKTSSVITVSEPGPEESENESEETSEGENVTLGTKNCVDSDGGINYNVKGRCVDDGPFILGMDDYCESNFELIELYCTNRTQRCRFAEPYECYCKNGACV
ncbi:hypothetical protein KY361_03500 [Candidatus Woesearchaeota archaeon]|nr:hypothetical protein [Candidatus Woesearchaeota archaeon]